MDLFDLEEDSAWEDADLSNAEVAPALTAETHDAGLVAAAEVPAKDSGHPIPVAKPKPFISFRWGPFAFTPKTDAQGRWASWEASCPYHRKSAATTCKKNLVITALGSDATIRALKEWCCHAPSASRQREHLAIAPLVASAPADAILDAKLQTMPEKPLPREVKTDVELDRALSRPDALAQSAGAVARHKSIYHDAGPESQASLPHVENPASSSASKSAVAPQPSTPLQRQDPPAINDGSPMPLTHASPPMPACSSSIATCRPPIPSKPANKPPASQLPMPRVPIASTVAVGGSVSSSTAPQRPPGLSQASSVAVSASPTSGHGRPSSAVARPPQISIEEWTSILLSCSL